jgi:bis(5'-nucleosyl)-tetraphosphatase (symmetrical)
MVHAGILPQWDLAKAQQYAGEVEQFLQGEHYPLLIQHMYGDKPEQWQESLTGWERLRFIVNVFTRIRFCTVAGKLDLTSKEGLDKQPPGYLPWFKIPQRINRDLPIIFGHWAALQGQTDEANVFALDTGCVWGNRLTAMRLEDQQLFSVPALRSNNTKL